MRLYGFIPFAAVLGLGVGVPMVPASHEERHLDCSGPWQDLGAQSPAGLLARGEVFQESHGSMPKEGAGGCE